MNQSFPGEYSSYLSSFRRIQERIAWKSKSTDRTSVYSCLFNRSSSNPSFIQSFLRKAAFI